MRRETCLLCLVSMILLGQSAPANPVPYKSSIQTTFSNGSESQEEINSPRLRQLAKVTAGQAKKIARSRFSGVIKHVDLENEGGNVVWSVEIGVHELAIDAGNGKILEVE